MKTQLVFQTPSEYHFYFGYYDKSQLNSSSSKLLAHRVNFVDRIPTRTDTAEIGFFDLRRQDTSFSVVTSTNTFNWQQGSMLQWLGPEFEDKIIYNALIEKQFKSVIFNIETNKASILPMAFYTVDPGGEYALCIDFERHFFCRRGYSYDGFVDEEKDTEIVEGDGIWRMGIETGACQKIIELKDLINNKPLTNMEGATHYVEHLMINPRGDRFCFLHRWKMKDGGIYDRLYTADPDGQNLYLLSDSGRIGHYTWRNDSEILAYAGLSNPFNQLRQSRLLVRHLFKPLLPIYHSFIKDSSRLSKALTGDSYVLMTDQTSNKVRVAKAISEEDGHPSFHRLDPNIFITDTYPKPENDSTAQVIMFNLRDDRHEIITTIGSTPEYDQSPLRCDLHPRWSIDGKHFSLDTMENGIRGSRVFKILK